MKNYVQPGNSIAVPAPTGGVTSGGGVLAGNLFGVAATTAAEGELVEIHPVGVFSLPKRATANFSAAGTLVSWDATEKRCDEPGSGLYPIGIATVVAGATTPTVNVRLDGTSTAAAL